MMGQKLTVALLELIHNSSQPNWIIIIMRDDDGSIVNNENVLEDSITANLVSGLQWVSDRNSGANNAPTVCNSKLLFGPVSIHVCGRHMKLG